MSNMMTDKEFNEYFERQKRKKKPVGEASTPPAEPIKPVEVGCDDAGQSSTESGNLANSGAPPSMSPGDLVPLAPTNSGPPPKQEIVLSTRTPNELLKMEFDPGDNYFENGIIAKHQSCILLGPAGVGKTRLALQMAVCSITGRPFLGWKPSKRKIRWLIIQAENSSRRLKADLAAIRAWIGEELWLLVDQNLIIHTLEKDHDTFLNLSDHASAELVARLVKTYKADVVLFDPLYAFATGNLNSDAAMLKTCKTLSDIARLGAADCAVVVLHHSLTGKAGARKATGYERGSYGRGSKALNMWTRGQINVAAVSVGNNDRLVIACGKNSNGLPFEDFGIRLDPDTMIYEEDPEFDVRAWQAELNGETNSVTKPTPEAMAMLVKDLPMARKALKDLVMEEFGCGQASAYALIAKSEGTTIRRNAKKEYEAIDD